MPPRYDPGSRVLPHHTMKPKPMKARPGTAREKIAPFLEDLQAGNVSMGSLAVQLNVSVESIKDTYRRWRLMNNLPVRNPKKVNKSFEIIGGLPTLTADPPIDSIWEQLAERSRKLKETGHKKPVRIKIDTDQPIGIAAISDQHIGGMCDYDQMREDAETIRETDGMFAILAGDSLDNHIKIMSAIIAQEVKPSKQLELFELYLSWFGDSILGLISGNHDLWTKKLTGFDVIKRLATEKKMLYHPEELRLEIQVGSQVYKFLVRHKGRYNSIYNAAHSHAQMWRLGDWPFDVGILAHTHTHACIPFDAHGLTRWALRPGAYQIYSSYAEEEGFSGAFDTRCPAVILYPDKRKIVGLSEIGDAATMLAAERLDLSEVGMV